MSLQKRILVLFVCYCWLSARACEDSNHDLADHDEKSKPSVTTSRHLRERLRMEQSPTIITNNKLGAFDGDGPVWMNDFQRESRRDQIESGSRCYTRDATNEERAVRPVGHLTG
jgi:hypothetical protein